ncbi:hypothetical protein [uncultured Nitratireductor sp.]|uniref:hypothetical protein n=1 Tax=uncultured Nitratireductor sp. TaxID=520953 RepID=UPI00261F9E0E|nr:hypothetical protein [uncultured Nitratireductor sp.]
MTRFIELHNVDGSPVLVNPARVGFVMQHNSGGAALHYMNGADEWDDTHLVVRETFEEVRMKFKLM